MTHETDIERITDRDCELLRERSWESANRMIRRRRLMDVLAFIATVGVLTPILVWMFR